MATSRTPRRTRGTRTPRASKVPALGPNLSIIEARSCWQALREALERGRAEADAHALQNVDTAGLQLLLAAGRTARARGLTFKVRGARSLLLESATSLGLERALTEVVELLP